MSTAKKSKPTLTPPCNCHVLDPQKWPWKDGKISIALCMETCPYCGETFPSCFDLQKHLLKDRYRQRGLVVIDSITSRTSEKVSPKMDSKASRIRPRMDFKASEVIDLTGSPPPGAKPRDVRKPPVSRPQNRERTRIASGRSIEVSNPANLTVLKIPQEDVILSPLPDLKPQARLRKKESETVTSKSPLEVGSGYSLLAAETPPAVIPPLTRSNNHTPQPESPKPKAKTKVQVLLDSLHKFDPNTFRMLQDIPLSTPEEASLETKELWTQSTATWPQIFESRFCWKTRPPSGSDLIIHTCNSIAARKEAEAKGKADDYEAYVPAFSKSLYDENLDPLTAVAQLTYPDITKPTALVGYRLPDLVPDGSLATPEALTQFIEPFNEENLQVLLTPEFWMTDLHIDNFDGLATTIGPTAKIWLTFPPTTKNLEQMRKAEAQRSKLARIGKFLEGGLVYRTTSADAIYVPVGCIHAVFTIHGGFLLSIEFNTPKAAKVLSALFLSDFHIRKDQYALSELPGQFIEAVALALRENQVLLGIEAWIKMKDHILRWAGNSEDRSEATRNQPWIDRRADWKTKVSETWNEFFSSSHSQKVVCPCGDMEAGESFREHFRAEHMFVKFKLPGGSVENKKVDKISERAKRKRKR